MISVYIREQKRYTQSALVELLKCSEEKIVHILKRLKEYGIVKAVKENNNQKDLSDLFEEEVEIADVEIGEHQYYYVFTFVGVVTIENFVLKFYPKYLLSTTNPILELKQVLKVLEKYNAKEQIIRMYNDDRDSTSFNMLAIMLFLLNDYFEYGSYVNSQDIVESNGAGEILWDKTINEMFALISDNRPYYPELLTMKHVINDFDYYKRLHECILTRCSNELKNADLLELFDMTEVEISDEDLEDFGDKEYILYQLAKELNVQFNTRKQRVLKTLYAYIANSNTLNDLDCFSIFGTNSFNLVWEKVCAEIFNNQLDKPIGGIPLPGKLANQYQSLKHIKLIDLIEKPGWNGYGANNEVFTKAADKTFIPDIISIEEGIDYKFIIMDAKYYNLQLEENKKLSGYPGIESVTKQYLYELAYRPFIKSNNISKVKNCFLFPSENSFVQNKGYVSLEMFSQMKLQNIQIIFMPADVVFQYYLENKRLDLKTLNL